MFKLSEMLKFTTEDTKMMADNAVIHHRLQIKNGLGSDNKPFKPYKPNYARRKRAGKFPKQINRSINPVNMTLTGAMFKKFDTIKSDYKTKEIKFTYGLKKNKAGTKFFHNNKTRTMVDDQELGNRVEQGIVDDFTRVINKNLKRMTTTKYIANM